jgi:hypothetical protein
LCASFLTEKRKKKEEEPERGGAREGERVARVAGRALLIAVPSIRCRGGCLPCAAIPKRKRQHKLSWRFAGSWAERIGSWTRKAATAL